MIAIQRPATALFPSPSHRPTHGRNPSAPVVVRPTHTPGLLSLSKPAGGTFCCPQQFQAHPRAHKNSPPKSKTNRSHKQPTEEQLKKSAAKAHFAAHYSVPSDRSPRGRQNKSTAPASKADNKRSTSLSSRARRTSHQPSPPPPTRLPQQTNGPARPSKPLGTRSANERDNDCNPFDPFVVPTTPDKQAPDTGAKPNKPVTYRAPPELSRPSGKLARRRQNGQAPSSPTPSKAVPVPRVKEKPSAPQLSSSAPADSASTPTRPGPRRVSTGPTLTVNWDFPICDDSDDVTPPSTPLRESASVPPKRIAATWQQKSLFVDDGPRTAPLSASFGYPFTDRTTVNATPTPGQRRRNHRRVPSEGMFAMSTDEDSSDASEGLKALVGLIPKHNAAAQATPVRRTPSPATPDASTGAAGAVVPVGFYAGSVFQNSPSPDELPVPAFRA